VLNALNSGAHDEGDESHMEVCVWLLLLPESAGGNAMGTVALECLPSVLHLDGEENARRNKGQKLLEQTLQILRLR
jgi:hypothetical protein